MEVDLLNISSNCCGPTELWVSTHHNECCDAAVKQVHHLHRCLHAPLEAVGQHAVLRASARRLQARHFDLENLDRKPEQLRWHLTKPGGGNKIGFGARMKGFILDIGWKTQNHLTELGGTDMDETGGLMLVSERSRTETTLIFGTIQEMTLSLRTLWPSGCRRSQSRHDAPGPRWVPHW